MKKVMLIGTMLLCGMMLLSLPANAQSRKDKKAAKKAEWEHQQKIKELQRQRELDSIANLSKPADEVFVDIPCYEESLSQGEEDPYFRELGIGEDVNRAKARTAAVLQANDMIKNRLGGVVKGLSTNYSKLMTTKSSPAKLEQIIEGELITVIDNAVRDAAKPCEKWAKDRAGQWVCYYVIWVGRTELANKMTDALAEKEELKAEFDREQFRKYAEEYMRKQQEYNNNNKQ